MIGVSSLKILSNNNNGGDGGEAEGAGWSDYDKGQYDFFPLLLQNYNKQLIAAATELYWTTRWQ